MTLQKCPNGHFYDSDKFQTCPHCSPAAQAPMTVPAQNMQQPAGQPAFSTAPMDATVPLMNNQAPAAPAQDNTVPLVNNAPKAEVGGANASVSADPADAQKTVGMFKKAPSGKSPVVGWLVCVEGPHFGEDFRIVSGRNFVGRAKTMDVSLAKDNSVSRDKHSIIVYEPMGNLFIMQAGESKELAYLNDKVVLSPQELAPYDKIKLGNSTLVFVPLCNEGFKWEDFMVEDEDDE